MLKMTLDFRTLNENIRLGKGLVNARPLVNNKTPESYQKKYKTIQQREAILTQIQKM